MKKIQKLALVLIPALAVCVCLYAGEYAGEFLSAGTGARALAMGGAFCAVSDDASAYYWNPAGVVSVKGTNVSSVKLINAAGFNADYTHLNAVYNPGEDIGAFGASYLKQSFGGIKIVDSSGIQAAGDKETADNVAVVTYSRKIAGWISAGVSLKVIFGAYPIRAGIMSYTGAGIDAAVLIDAGSVFEVLKGVKIGFNFQDPYTVMKWEAKEGFEGSEETIRPNLKTGISCDLKSWFLSAINAGMVLSGDLDTKYGGEYHLGAECVWNKSIAVRGGMKGYLNREKSLAQDAEFSFGGGIRWNFLGIDYAFVMNDMEPLQYVSVSGSF